MAPLALGCCLASEEGSPLLVGSRVRRPVPRIAPELWPLVQVGVGHMDLEVLAHHCVVHAPGQVQLLERFES